MSVPQIPNLTYVTTIAIASQATHQAAITHHGTMPNNLEPVPILVNFFPQQLIVGIANNLPTINVPTFVDPMEEFFGVLELELSVKSSEKIL